MGKENELSKEEKMKALKKRAADLESQLDLNNRECDDVLKTFKVVQTNVEEMVDGFKTSRFSLAVANEMTYDQHTVFNETNIVQHLAEMEEYISGLITYTAYKKEDPNAPISSVPLETLN